MEWIKDEHCRKKFFQELKKLWQCWLFDILLIIAVIGCIVYIILNINFQGNEISNIITLIGIVALPILISIIIPLIFNHVNTLFNNFYWSEKRTFIYRDLLEIITRIIDSLNRSFGNEPDFPELRGYYDIAEANHNIARVSNSAIEILEHPLLADDIINFNLDIYRADNIDEQITDLSVIYLPILSQFCTDNTVKLYFSILITDLIKLKECITLFNNERYWTKARRDAFNQIRNIATESSPIYNKIFPIVEAETNRESQNGIELYEEAMFENIKGVVNSGN